jgi:hypothetical protein
MQYETGELSTHIDHCHCTYCQKFHGAAFGSYAEALDPSSFRWLGGGDSVGRYQSSSYSARQFCTNCGSSLVTEIDGGKILAVTLGKLYDDAGVKSSVHMFARSKVSWFEIGEDEEKYDEYPATMSQFTPSD